MASIQTLWISKRARQLRFYN